MKKNFYAYESNNNSFIEGGGRTKSLISKTSSDFFTKMDNKNSKIENLRSKFLQ